MPIWKFCYKLGSVEKPYSENFAFLNLRIIGLFTREIYIFLKK